MHHHGQQFAEKGKLVLVSLEKVPGFAKEANQEPACGYLESPGSAPYGHAITDETPENLSFTEASAHRTHSSGRDEETGQRCNGVARNVRPAGIPKPVAASGQSFGSRLNTTRARSHSSFALRAAAPQEHCSSVLVRPSPDYKACWWIRRVGDGKASTDERAADVASTRERAT